MTIQKFDIKDLDDYKVKKNDYLKYDESLCAACIEVQGHRHEQEDSLVVVSLPGWQELSSKEQDAVLNATIAKMQSEYGTKETSNDSGSTVCVAVAWLDKNTLHAKAAYLGDSEAYMVIVDKHKVIEIQRLNKKLHNGYETSEIERINETGRQVYAGRVSGMLAVTRSIGDPYLLTDPSDHIADIESLEVILHPGQHAFLVVACDGLTEAKAMDQTQIANIIFANQHSPVDAAYNLVKAALEAGSGDNISVAVVPITSATPILGAIFDGHGGDTVSQNLGKNFYPTLKKGLKIN